jgi:hypothetical protein
VPYLNRTAVSRTVTFEDCGVSSMPGMFDMMVHPFKIDFNDA